MDDWRSYDNVAETYERVHAPRMMEPSRDLVAFVAPPTGARLLDVGTGTGVTAQAAAQALGSGGLVVGVDPSLGMLRVGVKARPDLRLAAANAIDLPFHDGTFDVVTASFVVSHFTDHETALHDMIRVLRLGGRLALSSWADGNRDELQNTWVELVEGVIGEVMLADVHRQAVPWSERFADRETIEETLMDAGLRHVRVERRRYHFRYSLDEYVDGLETWSTGRFVRSMLGPSSWEQFRLRARQLFGERFADPVNDFREVWLAIATKV
jgi:demethylmenaquinone methyltransferase/2-methoxy-6-polyprenyl-1,4-benzoquinol methylase